jgi:hypothetical protein
VTAMTFERQFIALFSAASFVITLGRGTASACDVSGWIPAATPTLSCLALNPMEEGRVDVRNDCSDSVEITPEGCDEPCSEAVSLDSKATGFLSLPAAAKSGDRRMFDYKRSDQTGSIEFTYVLNDCSADQDGGCSAASTGGQGNRI